MQLCAWWEEALSGLSSASCEINIANNIYGNYMYYNVVSFVKVVFHELGVEFFSSVAYAFLCILEQLTSILR